MTLQRHCSPHSRQQQQGLQLCPLHRQQQQGKSLEVCCLVWGWQRCRLLAWEHLEGIRRGRLVTQLLLLLLLGVLQSMLVASLPC
jgi:hypothetical protein